MSDQQKRMDIAEWTVSEAKKQGAQEVSVSISNSRDIEIQVRENQIEKLKESTRNSLNLSLYIEQCYSSHSTSNLDKPAMQKFIKEAAEMTKFLTPDPFRSLPDPSLYKGQKTVSLTINDPAYQSVKPEQRVEIAKEIEENARIISDKIISVTAEYGDTHTESVLIHSNGFTGLRESTIFSAGAEVTVRDGDRGRHEDWNYAAVRFFKDLPPAETIGKEAVNRALHKIGQGKIGSGVMDMILENRSVSQLFSALQRPMTARSIQQKSSFLEGAIGQPITADKLTVIDDPFISKGLGSKHYDAEGIAARNRVIIKQGVFKEYFIDNYYGKKLNMTPNGGSHSNITFVCGEKSQAEMVESMSRGILVTGFIGGNSNPTTGDFSFGITGLYIKDGNIVQPVNEMNITGNLKDLWMNLSEIGNDPFPYSSWHLPSVSFKGVNFSGI